MDVNQVEKRITNKTKAIVPVHLYGQPVDMDPILAIGKKHNILILEDAAPSIGTEYKGRKTGSMGHAGVYSFQGAKALVTGEGGIFVTNDEEFKNKAWFMNDHGRDPNKTLYNLAIGYKYKMSNVQAALGLAQVEKAEEIVAKKREIFSWYQKRLADIDELKLNVEIANTRNIYWMTSIVLNDKIKYERDEFISKLKERKIDYIRKVKIINKSKFYVDYIIKQRKDTDNVKGVFPKISIWNSYDGGSIMRYEFGFYRLVCSNGLTVPDGEITQKSFKHSTIEKIVKGDVINTLMEIKNFIDSSSVLVENFEKLAQIKVTKKKISFIGERIGLSKKIVQCAEERYDLESNSGLEYLNEYGEVVKHNGSEKNLFLVYNALNYGIYNTNLKELPEKKLEKDKKLMIFLLKEL
jgi:hypothetical protein